MNAKASSLVHGALVALAMVACTELGPPPGDIIAPRVVEFTPQGDDVSRDTAITVRFSETMSEFLLQDLVVLAASEQVDVDFLTDIDSPPLSTSRRSVIVASQTSFDQDRVLFSLQPTMSLAAGCAYQVVVSAAATDAAGNPVVRELHFDDRGMPVGLNVHLQHIFTTHAEPKPPSGSPAGTVISEVYASPLGDDSQGEYIELTCAGETPCDLSGCQVSDQSGATAGQTIAGCTADVSTTLQPQQAALLVSAAFVAPADLALGTPLLCVDGSTLTPYGLKNAKGEVLTLLDPQGQEISRYGGWIDFSSHEGCSALRIDLNTADSEDNWEVRTTDTCRSPGWID